MTGILRGDDLWDDLASPDASERNEALRLMRDIKARNPLLGAAVNELTGELRWANEGQ